MMNKKYIPPPIIVSEAFDTGWAAGFFDEVYTNPYCKGNAEYLDYELGYSQGKNSEYKDSFKST